MHNPLRQGQKINIVSGAGLKQITAILQGQAVITGREQDITNTDMQSDMQRLKDMIRLSYNLDSELLYFQMLSAIYTGDI